MITLLVLYYLFFRHPYHKRPNCMEVPNTKMYAPFKERLANGINRMVTTPNESVIITSHDGLKLHARLYIFDENAPFMIFCHGYKGTSFFDGYGSFMVCEEKKINILLIDERAHGMSQGEVISFGINESRDVKRWCEYLTKRFGRNTRIILSGVSMGASSVLTTCHDGVPEGVCALISDCGYSSPVEIVKTFAKKMNLPVGLMYKLVKLSMRVYGHFDLTERSPLDCIARVELPVLFIHGEEDVVVPFKMCDEMFKACMTEAKYKYTSKSNHATNALFDYENYRNAVVDFLDREVLN